MKTAEITLYDIFGYLITGCVGFIGIYLIAWRFVLPASQDWNNLSKLGWIAVVGMVYVLGHFMQALSNLLLSFAWKIPEQNILLDATIVPANVLLVAQQAACRAIGLAENTSLNMKTIYEIMDHYNLQHGKTGNRDIYIYREGFYRGLSVGLFILAVGSFIHMTGGQTAAAIFGVNITFTKSFMGFVAILSLIMAFFGLARYWRFAIYRVTYCLFSFLTIFGKALETDAENEIGDA